MMDWKAYALLAFPALWFIGWVAWMFWTGRMG